MHRYLTNNFSQSESFQPLERMHFNNLIQPLDFFNHWACQKYAKKFNRLKFCSNHWKFQPLKLAKILAHEIRFSPYTFKRPGSAALFTGVYHCHFATAQIWQELSKCAFFDCEKCIPNKMHPLPHIPPSPMNLLGPILYKFPPPWMTRHFPG